LGIKSAIEITKTGAANKTEALKMGMACSIVQCFARRRKLIQRKVVVQSVAWI
jgi:hypothetical protein